MTRWFNLSQYFAFSAALLAIKIWVIARYGNGTPYWDQWDAEAELLYKPLLLGTLTVGDLFAPHNEHRILTSRLLALGIFVANKMWSPLLQMVVNAILHTAVIGYVISVVVKCAGHKWLPAILLFSLILFGIPYAWENTLAGFQSQFYFVLLFSAACIAVAASNEPFSTKWWLGFTFAVLAFLSLAAGVFAAAACSVTSLALFFVAKRRSFLQLSAAGLFGVMVLLGILLTPSLQHHDPLKAHTFGQFANASVAALSWPLPSGIWAAIVRNAPALLVVWIVIRKRPPRGSVTWIIFTMVVWAFGHAVSIAYGRAVAPKGSRYLDLYAVAILVNFACLLFLARTFMNSPRWKVVAVAAWTCLVMSSLVMHSARSIPTELGQRRDQGTAQQVHTSQFLITGDMEHLTGKPYLHVPYPDANRLALLLSDPTIRAFLPTSIRSPLILNERASINNGFVPEGIPLKASTPNRGTVGSYGAEREGTIGNAVLQFRSERDSALIGIPVFGQPNVTGMMLQVQQGKKVLPLATRKSADGSYLAYAMVAQGEFVILLEDNNPSAWIAIGLPIEYGRLDPYLDFLNVVTYPLLVASVVLALGLLLYAAIGGRLHRRHMASRLT
jgi:hypothetical protein